MTDTSIRQAFASETEAKQAESGQECFSGMERGRVEPPNVTDLEGRATSNTEIQQYLIDRKLQRKRKYRREYMRKYRRKTPRATVSRIRTRRPHAGLRAEGWDEVWAVEKLQESGTNVVTHA